MANTSRTRATAHDSSASAPPLGVIHLDRLLELTGGRVAGMLVDAGMFRPFEGQYRFQNVGNKIVIRPFKRETPQITLPAKINITADLLITLGMYSGDGNKTGLIGFAQKETRIMAFWFDTVIAALGQISPIEVNILEDIQYFRGSRFAKVLAAQGITIPAEGSFSARDAPQFLKDLLWRELHERLSAIGWKHPIEHVSITISPKKGARTAGQSSREDIFNFRDSRPFLPLLLRFIEGCTETICRDSSTADVDGRPWLEWAGRPSEVVAYRVELARYVTSAKHCCYFSARGKERYGVAEDEGSLRLSTRNGRSFRVKRLASLGPRFLFAAGLYLAEGTTNKALFFEFHQRRFTAGEQLALSFNSSENTSLMIFLLGVGEILADIRDIVTGWKVKIGSQYSYEASTLAEKLGVPLIRSRDAMANARKGQGRSRSYEAAEQVKRWALKTLPVLEAIESRFSHIEFTGSGVPRVQVDLQSAPAVLIFALIFDLLYGKDHLVG